MSSNQERSPDYGLPAQPVTPDYSAGVLFAADVAHAEARWQTELALRNYDNPFTEARHRYAAERASEVEDALRAVAKCVLPSGSGDTP